MSVWFQIGGRHGSDPCSRAACQDRGTGEGLFGRISVFGIERPRCGFGPFAVDTGRGVRKFPLKIRGGAVGSVLVTGGRDISELLGALVATCRQFSSAKPGHHLFGDKADESADTNGREPILTEAGDLTLGAAQKLGDIAGSPKRSG